MNKVTISGSGALAGAPDERITVDGHDITHAISGYEVWCYAGEVRHVLLRLNGDMKLDWDDLDGTCVRFSIDDRTYELRKVVDD